MLEESPSIVTKNCTYGPAGRMPSPSSAADPFPSSSRLYARCGVAMVPGPPDPSVSGLVEAATLTIYTSTLATWLYGNGASMRRALVVPAVVVLVETACRERGDGEDPAHGVHRLRKLRVAAALCKDWD